jgi:hypothetical protein
MKFLEYLYVVTAFAVSCFLFFAILFVTAAALPGESLSSTHQLFFCCGLLYPVIVILSYLIVVIRLIKKRKAGILPVLPIIYFFMYLVSLVMFFLN